LYRKSAGPKLVGGTADPIIMVGLGGVGGLWCVLVVVGGGFAYGEEPVYSKGGAGLVEGGLAFILFSE